MLIKYKDFTVDTELNHDKNLFLPEKDKISFRTLTLNRLLEVFNDNLSELKYSDFLRTHEWMRKRMEILDRDNYRCTSCGVYETEKPFVISNFGQTDGVGIRWLDATSIEWIDLKGNKRITVLNKPIGTPDKVYKLHIHHEKYIENRLPWEYKNNFLKTLCHYCHETVHSETDIPVYNEYESEIIEYTDCDRCGGIGYLEQYRHVENGICFKCRATKKNVILIKEKRLLTLYKRNAG